MKKRLQNILFGGYVLVFIALLTLVYLVGESMNDQEANLTSLWFEQEVVMTLEETLASLQRAESSRRGFIITKDPEYVQSYNAATSDIERSLKYLKQLNVQRIYQDVFLDSLDANVNNNIMLLNSSIKVSMGSNTSDSIQIAMTDRGTEVLRLIRNTILQMLNEKRNSRDDRYRILGAIDANMRTMLRDGLIVLTIILSGLLFISYLHVRRTARADELLRFELYTARSQAQHATSRYQDLKIEHAGKLKSGGESQTAGE